MTTENTNTDPAVARKRRKAIINSQRSDSETAAISTEDVTTAITAKPSVPTAQSTQPSNQSEDKTTPTTNSEEEAKEQKATSASAASKKRKAPAAKCKTAEMSTSNASVSSAEGGGKGKKTQVRYDPDVPMSKEQLAAWRREARRVRNRESAAASRQRIRNRISELEEEVGEWKSKYAEAMERLKRLEQGES